MCMCVCVRACACVRVYKFSGGLHKAEASQKITPPPALLQTHLPETETTTEIETGTGTEKRAWALLGDMAQRLHGGEGGWEGGVG